MISDTVFISDDGKPSLFAKTDKDGKVIALHNKLNIQDIRMKIIDEMRKRNEHYGISFLRQLEIQN